MSNPPLRTPFLTSSSAVQPAFKKRGGGKWRHSFGAALSFSQALVGIVCLQLGLLSLYLTHSFSVFLPLVLCEVLFFLARPDRGVCVCMGGSELLCRLSLGQLLQLPAHYCPQWQTVNREREREREISVRLDSQNTAYNLHPEIFLCSFFFLLTDSAWNSINN